ncbi:hypothetical protein [Actinomadura rubrisoli]|uniref:Uncharacterized protein n=1 Tax=Actinomadura rubrisoli TaxID=2530368 RepID=A0A4R5BJ23_9ACTN|nr:hypothetical protein [Actinomadura rubrisoli]TDD86718.1 hypothetical protein E1298_17140 [Actinomadura rubrisoli]
MISGTVPAEGVLATHSAITALPFFVPTFVVVAVIVVVVWRDRRRGDDQEPRDDREPGNAP